VKNNQFPAANNGYMRQSRTRSHTRTRVTKTSHQNVTLRSSELPNLHSRCNVSKLVTFGVICRSLFPQP
jgi:hypothetical protein